MHVKSKQWLEEPRGLLERAQIPFENIIFVSDVRGRDGKGVAAKRLGLSHFVDNREDVLQAIFEDNVGNSREYVEHFDGILFHFAERGAGKWKPKPSPSTSQELKAHYCAVSGWEDVLRQLRKDICASSLPDADSEEDWMLERRLFSGASCHHVQKANISASSAPDKDVSEKELEVVRCIERLLRDHGPSCSVRTLFTLYLKQHNASVTQELGDIKPENLFGRHPSVFQVTQERGTAKVTLHKSS